jgi:hypothetical protein
MKRAARTRTKLIVKRVLLEALGEQQHRKGGRSQRHRTELSNDEMLKDRDPVQLWQKQTGFAMRREACQGHGSIVANDESPSHHIHWNGRSDALCWGGEYYRRPIAATTGPRGLYLNAGRTFCRRLCIFSRFDPNIASCRSLVQTAFANRSFGVNQCLINRFFVVTSKTALAEHQALSFSTSAGHARQAGSEGEGDHRPHQCFPEIASFAKHANSVYFENRLNCERLLILSVSDGHATTFIAARWVN